LSLAKGKIYRCSGELEDKIKGSVAIQKLSKIEEAGRYFRKESITILLNSFMLLAAKSPICDLKKLKSKIRVLSAGKQEL